MKIISIILIASLQAQSASVPEKVAVKVGGKFGELQGHAKPALAVPVSSWHRDSDLVTQMSILENRGPVEHLANVPLAPISGINWYVSKLHIGKTALFPRESTERWLAIVGLATGIGFAVMAIAATISLITNFTYFWAELFGCNN